MCVFGSIYIYSCLFGGFSRIYISILPATVRSSWLNRLFCARLFSGGTHVSGPSGPRVPQTKEL